MLQGMNRPVEGFQATFLVKLSIVRTRQVMVTPKTILQANHPLGGIHCCLPKGAGT